MFLNHHILPFAAGHNVVIIVTQRFIPCKSLFHFICPFVSLRIVFFIQFMVHGLCIIHFVQVCHGLNGEQAFARDKALSDDYNNIMSGGKWKNMMIQKHIGYTSWNDNFPADTLPKIYRIENPEKAVGGYVFTGQDGYIAIEAEHYYSAKAAPDTEWTVIPYMGRTLSGMALMPYTQPTDGASISYKIKLPKGIDKVTVHVIVKSTLAFHDRKGHEYSIGFEGGKDQTINFNHNLNELPENVYSIYYPTVARRIVEKKAKLNVPNTSDGMQTITFKPLDPGIVLEKLVVDYGGYKKSYLFMNESKSKRESR